MLHQLKLAADIATSQLERCLGWVPLRLLPARIVATIIMTMAIRQDIMHHHPSPIIMPHHLRHITAPPPTEAMHLRHGHRPGTGIANINIVHSTHRAVLTSLITGRAKSADNTSSRGRETGRRITE